MDTEQDKTAEPVAPGEAFARELAREALAEQRRARRWSVFFKSLLFLYLFVLLLAGVPRGWFDFGFGRDHTALVEINGVIAAGAEASADNVVAGLRAAFEHGGTRGVILRINSPGGSPVQAGYINDEIRRLREEHPDIPVYAVIADVCASGGYYVAVAADEIYADKASIVGSIGVRMDGFGFVEAIDKLGIERRLLTAGEHKAFLDPFLPLDAEEVEHVRGVLEEIHRQFIDTVVAGRRDRLAEDHDALFSGLVWTGVQGLELGLVDALGSASYVAREVIGVERIVDFTVRESYFARVGRSLGEALIERLTHDVRLR